MGICLSLQTLRPTTKLILENGGLREYPESVKVAEILTECPGFFVCHSDCMAFDKYLSPLSTEDELEPGHLYFLLPLNRLEYPLPATDMAALAVKAAAALQRIAYKNNNKRRRSKIMPVAAHDMDACQIHSAGLVGEFHHITVKSPNWARGSRPVEKMKRKALRRTTVSGGEYRWKAKLSPIPEAFAY